MYLFFDTSAIGKPKSWKAPMTDAFSWPRMMHISWLMYDENRELIGSANDIIQPVGFTIPEEAEKKHHVTHEEALEKGIPIKESLLKFKNAVDQAKYVISHNMKFNSCVVGAEMYRKGIDHRLSSSDQYCLMQESTWYTKIVAKGKYRWPSLQEIHTKMYQARYAKAGDAHTDCAVTAILFFALLDIEAIELF